MTPEIYQWAVRHHVSHQALHELAAIFGMHGGHELPPEVRGRSEAAVQSAVRLEAARKGVRLYRNNVGALVDSRGVPVRYGLANDTKELNETIKSSDLVGWRPFPIRPEHVGMCVAQTVLRECKKPDWRYTGTAHERAQLNWLMLGAHDGADAAFCTGLGTL